MYSLPRTWFALCAVALVGCSGGRGSGPMSNETPKTQRTVSTDPLAMIPGDSELVGHLDIQKLRASATWQRVEPRLLEVAGPSLAQMKSQCGIDPLASAREVTFGVKNLQQASVSAVVV